jgi:hypothetical protein
MLAKIGSRAAWKSVASAAVLAIAALAGFTSGAANATTVATFQWVSSSSSGGVVTPSGTVSISLPDSILAAPFTTNPSPPGTTPLTAAQMFASITGLIYTFGNGVTIGLGDLNSTTDVSLPSLFTSNAWFTSASTNTGGPAPGFFYLLTGMRLKGSKAGGTFQLADPAGIPNLPGPSIISLDSHNLTPATGPATVDAGYWQLTSVNPVPVPAALPLLFSGLAGLGGLIGRRRRAA